MQENVNENYEEKIGPTRKSVQSKIIIFILVGVVLLGIIGFTIYKLLKPSAIQVYEQAVTVIFQQLDEGLNFLSENTIDMHFEEDKIKNAGTITFETDIPDLKDFASYSLAYELGLDGQEKEGKVSLNLTKEDRELLNGIMYLVQDEMILKSEQLFSGLLKTKTNGGLVIEQTGSLNFDLLKKMTEKIKNAIQSSFAKEDFQVKDTTFQNEKVTEYGYTINSTTWNKIMQKISDSFLEDEALLNEISETYEISVSEVKEGLAALKNEREVIPVEIRLYTKGISKKVCGFAIYKEKEEVISGKLQNDEWKIDVPSMDILVTIRDKKMSIEIPMEEITATLEIEQKNKEEYYAVFKIIEPTNNIELEISLTASFKKESDSKASFSLTGNMRVKSGENISNFAVNLTNEISKVSEEFIDINPEEARDIESLTEEEQTAIENNFKMIFETEDSLNSLLDPFLIQDVDVQDNAYCTRENCQDCMDGYCVCSYYDENGEEQLIYCEDNFALSF